MKKVDSRARECGISENADEKTTNRKRERMSNVTGPERTTNGVEKIEKIAKARQKAMEQQKGFDDPKEELRRLVKIHAALTKASTAITLMASDRTNRVTGDTIPCLLPVVDREALIATAKARQKTAAGLEVLMTRQLREIPIYRNFLVNVFGVGPIVAAYLVAEIDIHKAPKISNLRRYCGMAVINGRLERRAAGIKSSYNATLRTRLFQMFSAIWKNAAKKSEARPFGTTSKYLDRWREVKHRELHSERVNMATNKWKDANGVERAGAKGHSHAKGWHKAADLFLEDLYMVWRACEGLPCWASYYEDKLGFAHGGKIADKAPKMLTIDAAVALVGDVGGRPASAPVEDEPLIDPAVEEDADL